MSNQARLVDWAMLAMLAIGYTILMASGMPLIAKILAALGFALVLLLWFTARELRSHANIQRASAVGDPAEILRLTEVLLARRRSTNRRAPLLIYRATAQLLEGQFEAALATLDAVQLQRLRPRRRRGWQRLYAATRLTVLALLGRAAEARQVFAGQLEPLAASAPTAADALLLQEATAKLDYVEGRRAAAREGLKSLVENVRIAESARAIHCYFLASLARDEGEPAEANAWLARGAALGPTTFVAAKQ